MSGEEKRQTKLMRRTTLKPQTPISWHHEPSFVGQCHIEKALKLSTPERVVAVISHIAGNGLHVTASELWQSGGIVRVKMPYSCEALIFLVGFQPGDGYSTKSAIHGQCDVRPTVTFSAAEHRTLWPMPNNR